MAPLFDSPPPSPDPFSRPRPRPPRSPGHSAKIRAQNRRRAYLENHPNYFQSDEHELAEREAEGRAKGYARVLEGSLLRGEERLAKLREQTVDKNAEEPLPRPVATGCSPFSSTTVTTPSSCSSGNGNGNGGGGDGGKEITAEDNGKGAMLRGTTTFSSLNAELTAPPKTRDEGRAQWEAYLRDRFIRGEDEDFDYALVDEDDQYDVLEREDMEEAWFDEEDPGWVAASGDEEEDAGGGRGKALRGETGIQDF
ncbi:hypothetical protein N657DRAFT_655244 [Parathielavia appendiculata]|uniref:CCD97-like C-terminal domain-containing protein n=1 Tax=Parathielavia appendiculata TaxID=2587402 RepID=A0AAN6Z4C0_9PEZI|nr:hypothetical protein N657DRAFT_655244 [Parathielavia appendiculata]